MSNQINTQSRRSFLKGVAYTSVLSLGGISSLAFASNEVAANVNNSVASCSISNINGISIIQQKMLDKETVTLINQSNKILLVDALQPITLEKVNGSLIVTVKQIESEATNGMIAISPSERISFDIKSVTKKQALASIEQNHVEITSENSVFNRIIPVQTV
ncbi:MAG: hypothetical protein V3U71_11405 [Cocleimonas sp.]